MAERRLDPRRIEMVDPAMAEIYRRMPPWRRVQIALDANRTARLVVEGSVRTHHPDWDDDRVRAEVARRMLLGSE